MECISIHTSMGFPVDLMAVRRAELSERRRVVTCKTCGAPLAENDSASGSDQDGERKGVIQCSECHKLDPR